MTLNLSIISRQKRAVPAAVSEKALEIGQKALEKQLEIMQEQQEKAGKFVNKKVPTFDLVAFFFCH